MDSFIINEITVMKKISKLKIKKSPEVNNVHLIE